MLMTIDLLPTIAQLVGAELPKHKIDGLDVWPVIAGEKTRRIRTKPISFTTNNNQLQGGNERRWSLETAIAAHLPHAGRAARRHERNSGKV